MNFDYDGLRELLSDELFNSYKMQLETAELNNEKNIVENIAMLYDSGIYSLEKNDYTEQLMVQLHVKMIDYIIDVKTGDIKFGNNMHRLENTYIITLEKSIRSEIKKCPECGAKITSKASQKCKHCDACKILKVYKK